MKTKRTRLDRLLAKQLQIPRKQVRELLLAERVKLDGKLIKDMDVLVDEFSQLEFDSESLCGQIPRYIMLNKPVGVVSATKDDIHKTVLDLLPEKERAGLHIVGRLDLNTSGLVLLTNDSRWSRGLMSPHAHVAKEYLVTLAHPLDEAYVAAFATGFYFGFENITTAPASLTLLSEYQARVILTEGKYHQIKRMFGRFRNPVLALHRCRIGELYLDAELVAGQWRALTDKEVKQGWQDADNSARLRGNAMG